MVEQTPTTDTTPGMAGKQRYPRSESFLVIRQVLLLRWYVPLVAFILYVLFNLVSLVVQNPNSLSLLLSFDKDINALVIPIGQHLFISIPAFVLSGIFVSLGYWAKADEEREESFIYEVSVERRREVEEKKQREVKEKQREAEEKQPFPTGFKLRHTLAGHTNYVNGVAWAPDGKMLASNGGDMTIRLWDPQSGALLRELTGPTDSVYSVAWAPDGKMLASSADDKTIRLWDPQSGALLRELTGHTSYVYGVAWAPDGKMLASSGSLAKSCGIACAL